MKRAGMLFLQLFVLCASCGCYSTTLVSGLTPSSRARLQDAKHTGLFGGAIEVDAPRDLRKLCPQGWAVITTEQSVQDEVFSYLVHFGIGALVQSSVSVWCAAKPGEPVE